MKRFFSIALAVFLLCSLFGCAAESTPPVGVPTDPATDPATEAPTEAPTDPVTEVPTQAPAPTWTLDSIVAVFEAAGGYYMEYADAETIAQMEEKLVFLPLKGRLLAAVGGRSFDEAGKLDEWVYVLRMELAEDAANLFENRKSFVATIENGACVQLGCFVVYGNASVIGSLEQN